MLRMLKNKKALSPVVGVIIMISVTIALAATIYVWVSSLTSPDEVPPAISVKGVIDINTKEATLTIISVQGNVRWEDIIIEVNGTRISHGLSGAVKAGDQITLNFSSYPSGSEVKIRFIHVPSASTIYEDIVIIP